MGVTDVSIDRERGEMSVATEHEASQRRLWELWADPRQLERWWGPPDYPATVTEHALEAGGVVRYHMTGPQGVHHGGWRVLDVDEPRRLELEDYFADADGHEQADLPRSRTVVTITERIDGTGVMQLESRYESPDQLAMVLDMGMEEGIRAALGQIDRLLAEGGPA